MTKFLYAPLFAHDLDDNTSLEFPLADFHQHIHAFAFIPGYKQHRFEDQDPINIKAVQIMGDLHDALEAGGYSGHALERFLVRVLFCLFADDTGIFERNTLGGGLVVTSMSNLGLHRSMNDAGIAIVETDVGDRNVLIALEEKAWPFGGEQSGHLIFRSLAPTGDGQLTGLMLADLIVRRGPLGEQANAAWRRVPQELINVARERYDDVATNRLFEELRATYGIEEADVRLLIRPSGTEPVVRVMIEALDAAFVDAFSKRLTEFFSA